MLDSYILYPINLIHINVKASTDGEESTRHFMLHYDFFYEFTPFLIKNIVIVIYYNQWLKVTGVVALIIIIIIILCLASDCWSKTSAPM